MRNECNIIRDILPLYIENMISQDTVSFVEEHLNGCAECRTELESMKNSINFEQMYESSSDEAGNDIVPLKVLKRKMRNRKILTIVLSSLSGAVIIGSMIFYFCLYGIPAHSDKIKLQTEFQYDDSGYLDQIFVLHMMHFDGLSLNATVKNVYETDEYGQKFLVGYEITPRTMVFDWGQNAGSYTLGYTYFDDVAPDEEFDFTITVKFKDKTVAYSMVEEGLFVPQEDVIKYYEATE